MPDLSAVTGFLTPSMVDTMPDGSMLNAFDDPRDIKRIEAGYACGNCCATFAGFRLECPLCGMPTEVTRQRQETPEHWQQHVDTRHADIPTLGKGEREPIPQQLPQPRTPEEFLDALAKDKDIDHIPLSKLGPRRNRSGR